MLHPISTPRSDVQPLEMLHANANAQRRVVVLRRPSMADLLADYRAAADALLDRLQVAFPRGLSMPLPQEAQTEAEVDVLGSLDGFVLPDALTAVSLLVRDERTGKIYTVPLAVLSHLISSGEHTTTIEE